MTAVEKSKTVVQITIHLIVRLHLKIYLQKKPYSKHNYIFHQPYISSIRSSKPILNILENYLTLETGHIKSRKRRNI